MINELEGETPILKGRNG